MTDTTKLDALIADVEAGAFARYETGQPKRYMGFADRLRRTGAPSADVLGACVALRASDAECAAFLKAYRAKVSDNAS